MSNPSAPVTSPGSDHRAGQTSATSSRAILRSYYCICGDFILVLQGKLDRLPQRRTDGAWIIRSQPTAEHSDRKFKLNAEPGQRCLVRRKDSDELEMRQPFACHRCSSTVAYQTGPPPAGSSPFLYVLRGALTEVQGRLPRDAFLGETAYEKDLADEVELDGGHESPDHRQRD